MCRYFGYSGAIMRILPHEGDTLHAPMIKFGVESSTPNSTSIGRGTWVPKLKILRNFGIYAPRRDISFKRVLRNLLVCIKFHFGSYVKIWAVLLKWLGSYWGLDLRVRFPPNIQHSLALTLYARSEDLLEVQQCCRLSLSPCQVWLGSDFARLRRAKKLYVFYF